MEALKKAIIESMTNNPMKKNCKNCTHNNNCSVSENCEKHNRINFFPIMKNRVLFTKDGRTQGNAICSSDLISGQYYKITTDYGNTAKLNIDEINGMFYLGGIALSSHKNYT